MRVVCSNVIQSSNWLLIAQNLDNDEDIPHVIKLHRLMILHENILNIPQGTAAGNAP